MRWLRREHSRYDQRRNAQRRLDIVVGHDDHDESDDRRGIFFVVERQHSSDDADRDEGRVDAAPARDV